MIGPLLGVIRVLGVIWDDDADFDFEYTILAVIAVVFVVVLEKRVLRTGLFRSPSYWSTMAICGFFMVLVNGWLTKLSAPIVVYAEDEKTSFRFPWDIPVEDFLFGFSLLTAVLLAWVRQDTPDDPAPWSPRRRAAETGPSGTEEVAP